MRRSSRLGPCPQRCGPAGGGGTTGRSPRFDQRERAASRHRRPAAEPTGRAARAHCPHRHPDDRRCRRADLCCSFSSPPVVLTTGGVWSSADRSLVTIAPRSLPRNVDHPHSAGRYLRCWSRREGPRTVTRWPRPEHRVPSGFWLHRRPGGHPGRLRKGHRRHLGLAAGRCRPWSPAWHPATQAGN